MDLALNTGNDRQGFAEIHLRVSGRMLQRYEHFPALALTLTDIVGDDRSAAIKTIFVDPVDFVVGDAAEDIGEPGLRIDVVELGSIGC